MGAACGRHRTPVAVILRLLVIKRRYGWSDEQTEHLVADRLVLRQFCRVSLEPAPDDTTLLRWSRLIGPETLERRNGRVVETTIHHPTDRGAVGDGAPALGRLLRRAKAVVGEAGGLGADAFRSHNRTVRGRT